MKNYILIISLLIFSVKSKSQDSKNRLSIEFGYGINSYSMAKLNKYYIDSFATLPTVNLLKSRINSGQNFSLVLKYKPTKLFDIGFYGNYQYGNTKYNPSIIETNDFGVPIKQHFGKYELRTEAIGVGVAGCFYLSQLFKLEEKKSKIFKRIHFGVELNGGIGFSKVIADMRYQTLPLASYYEFFTTNDFQGQSGINIEYDFIKSSLISSIGIRGGYQYFKTKTVSDRLDRNWEVGSNKQPINLDFSGFYIGTYLKISK